MINIELRIGSPSAGLLQWLSACVRLLRIASKYVWLSTYFTRAPCTGISEPSV
jgi:hypothetical protein